MLIIDSLTSHSQQIIKNLAKRIMRFVVAGTISAFVMFGTLLLASEVFGLWYLASSVIAFVVTLLFGFVVQKFWAFQNKNTKVVHKQFLIFIIIALLNLIVNISAMYLLVDIFNIWYVMAQLVVTGMISTWDFLLYNYVIFPQLENSKIGNENDTN